MVADCDYTPDEDNNDSSNSTNENTDDSDIQLPSIRLPSLGLRFPPRTRLGKGLFSLVVSGLLLSTSVNLLTLRGVLMLFTLSVLLYIIIDSATGGGAALSLPNATYPLPPHLGHDGVSLEIENM